MSTPVTVPSISAFHQPLRPYPHQRHHRLRHHHLVFSQHQHWSQLASKRRILLAHGARLRREGGGIRLRKSTKRLSSLLKGGSRNSNSREKDNVVRMMTCWLAWRHWLITLPKWRIMSRCRDCKECRQLVCVATRSANGHTRCCGHWPLRPLLLRLVLVISHCVTFP